MQISDINLSKIKESEKIISYRSWLSLQFWYLYHVHPPSNHLHPVQNQAQLTHLQVRKPPPELGCFRRFRENFGFSARWLRGSDNTWKVLGTNVSSCSRNLNNEQCFTKFENFALLAWIKDLVYSWNGLLCTINWKFTLPFRFWPTPSFTLTVTTLVKAWRRCSFSVLLSK